MADTHDQADIRGLDIDKLAHGFAEEIIGLDKHIASSPTKNREIRWFQKTAGILGLTGPTTGITASQIANTDFGALPVVINQSWTRNTSYVRKYFVTSELITDEDIQDSDVDVFGTYVRDLVRAVKQQKNLRIWNVISEGGTATNLNSKAITDEWDDATNMIPVSDMIAAKASIRSYGYDPEGAIFLINDVTHGHLLNWIIATKGANIPQFASDKIVTGRVMEFMGTNVVVDVNVTADKALLFVPQILATWKSFSDLKTATVEEPLMGKKIRVALEGECILHDPKAGTLFTNIGPT
jgi:hypothetical protein